MGNRSIDDGQKRDRSQRAFAVGSAHFEKRLVEKRGQFASRIRFGADGLPRQRDELSRRFPGSPVLAARVDLRSPQSAVDSHPEGLRRGLDEHGLFLVRGHRRPDSPNPLTGQKEPRQHGSVHAAEDFRSMDVRKCRKRLQKALLSLVRISQFAPRGFAMNRIPVVIVVVGLVFAVPLTIFLLFLLVSTVPIQRIAGGIRRVIFLALDVEIAFDGLVPIRKQSLSQVRQRANHGIRGWNRPKGLGSRIRLDNHLADIGTL